MKNDIYITNRENIYSKTCSLGEGINRSMNYQYSKGLEEWLKRMLDNRPRYSKRIPTKLYMKFHTLDIIRGEAKTYKEPGIGYKLEQESKIRLKFRFLNLFN